MEYRFVKIGKKDLPIKFGFGALAKFSKITNTSLQDLDKIGVEMTLDGALNLIYCGIEAGYKSAKQDIDITIDELADLMDGDFEAISRCMVVFAEQMGGSEKKQKAKKK